MWDFAKNHTVAFVIIIFMALLTIESIARMIIGAID